MAPASPEVGGYYINSNHVEPLESRLLELRLSDKSQSQSTSAACSPASSVGDDAEAIQAMDQQRAPYDNPAVMSHRRVIHEQKSGESSTSSRIPTSSPNGQNVEEKAMPPTKPRRRFPEEEDEDILRETDDRFVLFPIKYREVSCTLVPTDRQIWYAYKQAQASFWTAEELDLACDLHDWHEKLNDNERFFVLRILAFFASSDGIVGENLIAQFSLDVQAAEARAFYAFQTMIEQVHAETYSLLIETYVQDSAEKDFLFKGLEMSK